MNTLLQIGLSNALAATVLAVPVAIAARVCRRPALAHALWLLVLLKLLTPPLFWVPLPWPDPLTVAPLDESPMPVVVAVPAPVLRDLPAHAAELPEGGPVVDWPAAAEIPNAAPLPRPAAHALQPASAEWPRWGVVVSAVWLLGTALWWAVAGVRVARFRRLLRCTTAAADEVLVRARRLAERLGLRRCPRVWLVPARVSPLLWAVGWTPRLLLPADLWLTLTSEQRDTLLLHELAHLRRRDHWVRRLELLVLGLFWWHPVAWWARHELAEAEEVCCDAWVVWALPEAGPAYAAALVQTLAFLSPASRPVPVAASGVGRTKSLKRRLFMILQRPTPRSLSGAGLIAVLGLGGLLLPLLPTWAEQQSAASRSNADPVPATVAQSPTTSGAVETPARGKQAGTAAAPAPQAKKPANRELVDQIEKLRDEVEILEAQVAVKRAQLKAAQANLVIAEQRWARLTNLQAARAVSQAEIDRAKAELAVQKAQVAVKEAELLEPQVRLRQVTRRLAALQGRSSHTGDADKTNWAKALFQRRTMQLVLPRGSMGKCGFALANTTTKPVHISAVRTSSGAVTVLDAGPRELAPGQKGFIDAQVDARRFRGTKVFTIWVAFDKPGHAEVKLELVVKEAEVQHATPPAPASGKEHAATELEVDKALKRAFGDKCPEIKFAIKMHLRQAGLLVATEDVKFVENGRRLRLTPCSIARFKPDGTRITTLRTSEAYFSFDRPVSRLYDLGTHLITTIECADGALINLGSKQIGDKR